MGHSYLRYLYPVDLDRPRGGLVLRRMRDALLARGLVTSGIDTTARSMVLTPAGALAHFAERGGLFEARLYLAVFGGAGECFVDPWADDGDGPPHCPNCDWEATDPQVDRCRRCAEPYDVTLWPVPLTRTLFRAKCVVALGADHATHAKERFSTGVPDLVEVVERVLGGAVREVAAVKPHDATLRRPTRPNRFHWAQRADVSHRAAPFA